MMVHEKQAKPADKRALMIRSHSHRPLAPAESDGCLQIALDEIDSRVRMGRYLARDTLTEGDDLGLSLTQDCTARVARLVIDTVFFKYKPCLPGRQIVAQIQIQAPYDLQSFAGLPGYRMDTTFVPVFRVEIHKRMGRGVTIDAQEKTANKSPGQTRHGTPEQQPEDLNEAPSLSSCTLREETLDKRCYPMINGVQFAGKPLGRPVQITETNREELERLKAQRGQAYPQRITIKCSLGQRKSGYRLNGIRDKRLDTAVAWLGASSL